MELSQSQMEWLHCFEEKFAKILLPPDSLDVDAAYQDFCNTIKKAAKKTIPRGYQNNYYMFRVGMQSANPFIKLSSSPLRNLFGY